MITIPRIEPVADGARPLWSVMIPAYEGAEYLARTIRSVLVQDPGEDEMQIEVVDDYSVKEDLKAIVDQVGKGRVDYYRKPKNGGLVANFNTCLERSRGVWIHILHADDTVLPGFYEKLKRATEFDEVGAAFCRHLGMDEDDHWTWISPLEAKVAGVVPRWIEKIAVQNHIQAPSIVVSRQTCEQIGGFDPRLSHCADWDMWKRIASAYPVWYEPTVRACYRIHSHSDTSRLTRTGYNVREMRRSIEYARAYLPETSEPGLTLQARRACANFAMGTASEMLRRGDIMGATAQAREALRTRLSPWLLVRLAKAFLRHGASCLLSRRRVAQSQ